MRSDRQLKEQENLRERLSQFEFKQTRSGLIVEGLQHTGLSCTGYLLRIPIPPGFPDEMPHLYLASPRILPKRGGGTLNQEAGAHEHHTRANGPLGCIQICHCREWEWHASRTLFSVLVKGIYWCLFYDSYMRTGRSIAYFFDQWKQFHNS